MGCCCAKARIAALHTEIEKMQTRLERDADIAHLRVAASEEQCAHQLAESIAEQSAKFSQQRKDLQLLSRALETKITVLDEEITKLQDAEHSQLQAAVDQIASLTAEKTELQERLVLNENIQHDLEEMTADKKHIEKALKCVEDALEDLRFKKEQLEKDLEKMHVQNSHTQRDLEQTCAEKASFEQSSEDLMAQKSKLEMQLDEKVCELNSCMWEAGAQVEKLEAEKEELQAAFESYRHEQNLRMAALEATNQHLWAERKAAVALESSKWVGERQLRTSQDYLQCNMMYDVEF